MAAFDTSTLQRAFAPAEVFSLLTTKSTPALVLIGGCGGSGKSTLARYLSELSPLPVVHLDDFAQPGVVGWDEQRFDAQVAVPLAHRQAVRYQRYDWDADRLAEWHIVEPKGTIAIEGVTALTINTRGLDVVKIWVDAPRVVRLARGVARDGESMRPMWTDTWMPEEDVYAWSQRPWEFADFVVDGTLAFSG